MRTLKLALLCLIISIGINAQTTQKLFLIDGYFFNEIPVSKDLLKNIQFLRDGDGTTIMVIELTKPLSEKIIKKSIPKEEIANADVFLDKYEEQKANSAAVMVSSKSALKVGDKFPSFSATDIDGNEWSSKDVQGKVMVLNLWFTGCGPCIKEMPELSTWKDEMPDVMFFSSTYESEKYARPVIESKKFNWIPLVNEKQFKQIIGGYGYPVTVVIDKDGVVAQIEFGTSQYQRDELKETIKKLR